MSSLSSNGVPNPADAERRCRIEAKLDLVLAHLGLTFDEAAGAGLGDEVRQLADPGQKIEAIKRHRVLTGAGLREAKDAVDAYLAGRG